MGGNAMAVDVKEGGGSIIVLLLVGGGNFSFVG